MGKKTNKRIALKNFSEDVSAFSLLAIRSTEPDTRMAWLLNRALHLDFVHYHDLYGKEPDNPLQPTVLGESKPEERRQFAVFRAADNSPRSLYTLITNRQNSELLIKKFVHVDYLLKISEALPDNKLAALSATIRAIPGVQACIVVANEFKNDPLLVTLKA
ncbi:MAG: IPExxxVDY family protein [Prevotellaceae bacterium]|jgi:hypothetical protein|nr:IPExxxVDY family protein [Prevotellaceae bacterium]